MTLTEQMHAERERVRREMGGASRIEAIHAKDDWTARDWIGNFLDKASFQEIGTFVTAEQKELRARTPGDGRIGGHGRVNGRPVTVGADDVTVKSATDASGNKKRVERIYEQALEFGNPFVYFGQAGGARIPDIMGSERMARGGGVGPIVERRRRIPMAMGIVGRSYGESSFLSALSDFVVQKRGAVLNVTSPRVIEMATSEIISEEDLGGADIHAERTGQIDLAVDTKEEVVEALRTFLSYLPDNAMNVPTRLTVPKRVEVPELRTIVPEERRRGYDMRKVIAKLVDGGEYFELRPRFGRPVITALARFDGWSVGIVASQPMQQGGSLTPDTCDKTARFAMLCDSFNIPMIFLADSPGFLVGRQVEHNRMLYKAIMLNQALVSMRVPRLTVNIRKAYGLAYFSLCGGNMGASLKLAWPTAEISFMDPEVAVNVVYAPDLAKLEGEARKREAERMREELKRETDAFHAASGMGVDEIVDPAETPVLLADALERLMARYDPRAQESKLALWPTCF